MMWWRKKNTEVLPSTILMPPVRPPLSPKYLHLGNGDKSEAQSFRLVKNLLLAFHHMEGVQQMMCIAETEEIIDDSNFFIANTACEIYSALTGLPISARETLKKMTD